MANSNKKVYIALLRGINVGGKNIIKMADLKDSFASLKFEDVTTYIQSGNIFFTTKSSDKVAIIKKIESGLSKTLDADIKAVVISDKDLDSIVKKAPKGFRKESEKFKYDVIFLKEPLMAQEALEKVFIKEGVDTATAGDGVLYFSRLIANLTQSRLNKIVGTPVYKNMTIRNWNTTTKLLNLVEKNKLS